MEEDTPTCSVDLSDDYLAPTLRSDPDRPAQGFEYLDHTADVQLHAWGPTLKEAFEQCTKAMFGYMTELDTVEECTTLVVETTGHDLQSALYNFMDEWLFNFCADPFFVPFKIEINEFERSRKDGDEEGEEEVRIKAIGFGDTFSLDKHPQGTEVKAITYSAMQINEEDGFAEVFVIIDI
jgi:SHS2 domain-containing protein